MSDDKKTLLMPSSHKMKRQNDCRTWDATNLKMFAWIIEDSEAHHSSGYERAWQE